MFNSIMAMIKGRKAWTMVSKKSPDASEAVQIGIGGGYK